MAHSEEQLLKGLSNVGELITRVTSFLWLDLLHDVLGNKISHNISDVVCAHAEFRISENCFSLDGCSLHGFTDCFDNCGTVPVAH